MKRRRMLLATLLSIVLVFTLILPTAAAGTPSVTMSMPDHRALLDDSGPASVMPQIATAGIEGQIREVNCEILTGVHIAAYLDDDEKDSTFCDGEGNYTLELLDPGQYEVVVSKWGFREERQSIDVELEQQYTLDFTGDHGLIPNDADLFYVLDCLDLWLYPPDEECGLTLFRVLDVIDAWLYPVIEKPTCDLTIDSTIGGNVTTPGEGTFTYDEGTVVDLEAEPEEGYIFVKWTGDVDTIADVNAASTNITTDGDYSITANFSQNELISSVSAQAGPDPFPSEMGTYSTWPAKENSPARLEAHVSGGSGSYTFDWYRIPGGSYNGAVDSKTWFGSGNPYVFALPDEGYGWWEVSVTVTDLVSGQTKTSETGFHVLPDPANRLDPDGDPPTVNPVLWVPKDSFPDNVVPESMIDQLNRSLRRVQAAFFDVYGKTFRMNPLKVIVSTKSEYDLYGGDRTFPYYDGIVMGQAIDEAEDVVGCVPYTRQVLVLAWGAGGWAGAWGCDRPIAGVGEWGISSASGMQIPTLAPDAPWWLIAPDLPMWNIMFDPNAWVIAHEINNSIGWNDPYAPFMDTPHTPLEIAIGRDLPWLYETMSDTEDPTVSIVSPADGTVVSGTITVSVDASDADSGIDAVVLTIDDCWFGVSTTPPYSFSVDTTEIGHGPRRLTAIAYDKAGRIAQADIHVRVHNELTSCPDTYPQDSGHVCYYDGIGFSGDYLGALIDPPHILATDGSFGFLTRHDFGTGEIAFGKSEGISGVWRARINSPEGWYKFVIQTSDGVRFYVNEELILDEWQDQDARLEPTVELSGTTNIKVEWYTNRGHALLEIFWQPVSPPEVETSEIRDWHDLHAIRGALGGHYVMKNDLDSTTPGYEELASPTANEGKGWQPIGTETHPFFGTLDGQGYEIRDLFIDRPDEDRVGIFGSTYYVFIENVGAVDVTITGNMDVGALVGHNHEGTVSNSHSSGVVTGDSQVGSLIGWNSHGTASKSHSTGSVSGYWAVGGLVGGSVGGTVTDSYSKSVVTGVERVGGLVGWNCWHSLVINAYSTGDVTGHQHVGGVAGINHGTVSNTYSTGSVSGDWTVGGLVGYNEYGSAHNSYSTGTVSGEGSVGGLVGESYEGSVINSFWDVETSGMEDSDGGTGKTTAEMTDIATFTDTAMEGLDQPWEIVGVDPGETDDGYTWNIVDEQTYPFLSWQAVS